MTKLEAAHEELTKFSKNALEALEAFWKHARGLNEETGQTNERIREITSKASAALDSAAKAASLVKEHMAEQVAAAKGGTAPASEETAPAEAPETEPAPVVLSAPADTEPTPETPAQ